MTAREAKTRLMDMRADRRTGLVLVTSTGLLAAWLFFGWLALADQMNLIPETSSRDEHALLQLASERMGSGLAVIHFRSQPVQCEETGVESIEDLQSRAYRRWKTGMETVGQV